MAPFNIDTTGEQIVAEFGANADGKTCMYTGASLD